MKEENRNEKKKKIIIIVLICLIFLLLIGITFAWFRFKGFSGNTNTLITGTTKKLEVRLDEYDGKTIQLLNTYPLTDNSGIKTKAYEFSLVNNMNYKLKYSVQLILDEDAIKKCGCHDNLLDDSVLRYQLIRNDSFVLIDTLVNKENWIIDNYTVDAFNTNHYSLRLWLAENAENEYMGKHFHAKIKVDVIEDN